jgi:carbonic anhydrase/acetyltransferase-like protein (isoleucine patch superfamily)
MKGQVRAPQRAAPSASALNFAFFRSSCSHPHVSNHLHRQCVILHDVVIRSDLCARPSFSRRCQLLDASLVAGSDRIKFGHHCVLGAKSVVQPAAVVKPDGTTTYPHLTVGSCVSIGSQCSISALSIGSHVLIGDGAVIGNGVDVKSCVIVTSGSVVKEGATLPAHTGDFRASTWCIAEFDR